MIEAVLYNVMIEVPRAMAIWSALLVLALLTLATVLAGPRRRRRAVAGPATAATDDGPADRLREPDRRQRLAAKAQELTRYAEEVRVAADRAANSAQRRRAEWLSAQEEVERAWEAFDAADVEVRRLSAGAAFPTPRTPQTPAEYADRERYLHQAAMRACGHGQLPVLALSDALAHRAGWDPRRHPVDQELILRRVIRDGRLAAYRSAVDREREAWRAAEAAATAARSLREEAATAMVAAQRARRWLSPADTPTPPRSGAARRSRPVLAGRWRAARAG